MPHKSALTKVTADDIDSTAVIQPEGPVNILRERTFNPELSSLLNKIYSHEKSGPETPQAIEYFDLSYKNKILQKCDRLIYRLKHINEAATISSSFNPFGLDINVYDDIDDLNDYICAGMTQAGFNKFLLMKYNFKDAAFRTDLNKMDEIFNENLYFSIKDPIFKKLEDSDSGLIISPEEIEEDPFLNKKFCSATRKNDSLKPVYLARINNICGGNGDDSMLKNTLSEFEEYLSPIIAIQLGKELQSSDTAGIHEIIKNTSLLPLSLYTMKNRIRFDSSGNTYEDALLMIELFGKSPAGSKKKTSIFTLNNYSVKDNIFILKYLLSVIKKRLEKNSLFLRISIDKCILIASEQEQADIKRITDEINSFEKIISVEYPALNFDIDSNHVTNLFL